MLDYCLQHRILLYFYKYVSFSLFFLTIINLIIEIFILKLNFCYLQNAKKAKTSQMLYLFQCQIVQYMVFLNGYFSSEKNTIKRQVFLSFSLKIIRDLDYKITVNRGHKRYGTRKSVNYRMNNRSLFLPGRQACNKP